MLKRKKGFTLIEVLVAGSIMSMAVMAGISIMVLCSSTLFAGQLETGNRAKLYDNIYYITREVQSAEGIRVSSDGKKLQIKQIGSSGYNLEYSIQNRTPTAELRFNDKKILDVVYEKCRFSIEGNSIKLDLALYKNNLDFNQIPEIVSFEITPRSHDTILEVGD